MYVFRFHSDCVQGSRGSRVFLTAGRTGGYLNPVQIEKYHQGFAFDAMKAQIQVAGESAPGRYGSADERAVRYAADDVFVYIISVAGGNGSVVVVCGRFAERGDAECIFRAADKPSFLRTVNQGRQPDTAAFPEDAHAFQRAEFVAAEGQHVHIRGPEAHIDPVRGDVAGGVYQQKAVMFFDDRADSGNVLDGAGFRTGRFDADKRAKAVVCGEKIIKSGRGYFPEGINGKRRMVCTGFTGQQHGFVGGRRIEDFVLAGRRFVCYEAPDGQRIAGRAAAGEKNVIRCGVQKSGNGCSCLRYELAGPYADGVERRGVAVYRQQRDQVVFHGIGERCCRRMIQIN